MSSHPKNVTPLNVLDVQNAADLSIDPTKPDETIHQGVVTPESEVITTPKVEQNVVTPGVTPEVVVITTLPRPGDTSFDDDPLAREALELKTSVYSRLQADGRWTSLRLYKVRDDMMRECTRDRRMEKSAAQVWTYRELDRLYPPLPVDPPGDDIPARPPVSESARLAGLSDIPVSWGELSDNASLAAEIGWCQANRLRIVEERPSGATHVHLDRARSPAPSWAALGWLETSIRSYAKFVDVAARCMGDDTDEAEHVKREQLAIEDIKALLDEMHRD